MIFVYNVMPLHDGRPTQPDGAERQQKRRKEVVGKAPMAADRGQKQRKEADDTERSAEHLHTNDVSVEKMNCRGKCVKALYGFQLPFDGVNSLRQG